MEAKFRPAMTKEKRIRIILSICMILFSSVFAITYNLHIIRLDEEGFGAAGLFFALRYIPIMITAALGGNIPGMISVLIIFVFRSLFNSSFSYMTFIYLMVVWLMDMLARRKWFDSVLKAFPVSIFMQIMVGPFWGMVLLLLTENGLGSFSMRQCLYMFINELPGCLMGSIIIYLIFNKIPDKKKLYFVNGKYYVPKRMLNDDDRFLVEGRSRLGYVVTNIIVFEALILGISAELASNTITVGIRQDYVNEVQSDSKSEIDYSVLYSTEKIENAVSESIIKEAHTETLNLTQNLFDGEINWKFSIKLAMIIAIIVMPMAVFVNWYAQKRIAEPIRALSKAMANIYSTNEKELARNIEDIHNLSIDTNDEIEELYHAVDLSVYRLVEYIDLVKTRQNIEDELTVAQSANEAKTRFLSNMSHEIRTPINAVLGFDEMILRECRDENILGYANDIKSSGKTLLALVNDILDFSKIEAGKMEIVPVEYELGSLLNDLTNMSEMRAREKNLKLTVNVNRSIPHILFGDEVRIKQCIINIVTNAVKYTETGSVDLDVNYEVMDDDDPVENNMEKILLKVSVSDTGIGIREEDMDKLTSAFERIDVRRNRTIEGTGLGISIVTSLLDMMGSKLEVKSEYGKGSVFSFAIVQNVVDWEPVGIFPDKAGELRKIGGSYTETFRAPDARILVVDDTRTNLTVIVGLLKQTQIKVDTATSGKEALTLVAANHYDIIFLDHRMPEMDGIQTFHAMESLEGNKNSDTPVIALTANAISGSREMYLREGFRGYMSKPVDPKKLEE
ncbi:MAG: response regulator, partial [Butyrivibrio sp.]|nr:response regulator [Butyrivibrio sp.]